MSQLSAKVTSDALNFVVNISSNTILCLLRNLMHQMLPDFSLNHLLLPLISTLLKLEISKQTNAKADDSNF